MAAIASASGTRAWLVSKDGSVAPVGATPALGEVGRRLLSPVTAAAVRPDGSGYWLLTASGHVYGFGSARSSGSLPAARHHGTAVGIASAPGGSGYWVVTSGGEVQAFGTAPSLGSVRPGHLRGRIVGIAPSTVGAGYWLASSSGSVYAFGSARSLHPGASTPGPAIAIVSAPQGKGYWLVGPNGAVQAFGSAASLATPPSIGLTGVVAAAAAR